MNGARDRERDRAVIEEHAGAQRIALIAQCYEQLVGRALVSGAAIADEMWNLPAVVLAHGAEDDPICFYANRAALDRFDLDGETLIAMPSRLTAEEPRREERDRFLERVNREGFSNDYSGLRVASTGKRFRIARATVWNLHDASGARRGQAATFSDWTDL